LVLDFIRASEDWQAHQQNEEHRRLEERERLVKERETAQTVLRNGGMMVTI
jgi:hypothetical protein